MSKVLVSPRGIRRMNFRRRKFNSTILCILKGKWLKKWFVAFVETNRWEYHLFPLIRVSFDFWTLIRKIKEFSLLRMARVHCQLVRRTRQFVGGKVVKGSNVGGSIFTSRQLMPVNRWRDPSRYSSCSIHGEKNSGNKFSRRLMAHYTILLPELLQCARFLRWKIAMAATWPPIYIIS